MGFDYIYLTENVIIMSNHRLTLKEKPAHRAGFFITIENRGLKLL